MTSLSTPGWIREGTTDSNGILSIEDVPYGEISVVETKAPEGYLVDPTVRTYRVDAPDVSTSQQIALIPEHDFRETPIAFDIEVAKFKTDGGEGVEARIARRGSLLRDRLPAPRARSSDPITTGKDGFASSEGRWFGDRNDAGRAGGALPYDRNGYTVREVASTVPDGYARVDDWTISPEQDGERRDAADDIVNNSRLESRLQIVKRDRADGAVVPLKGFSFQIIDSKDQVVEMRAPYPNREVIDTFSTDETGSVTLPEPLKTGSYRLREVRSVSPYTSSANKKSLRDIGEKRASRSGDGGLPARRGGDRLRDDPQNLLPRRQAPRERRVRRRRHGRHRLPDGCDAGRQGRNSGHATTDEHGIATVGDLPLGKGTARYAFIETKPPQGHALDAEPIEFVLRYKDDSTPIVSIELHAENQPTELVIEKTSATSKPPCREPISGSGRKEDEAVGAPREGFGAVAISTGSTGARLRGAQAILHACGTGSRHRPVLRLGSRRDREPRRRAPRSAPSARLLRGRAHRPRRVPHPYNRLRGRGGMPSHGQSEARPLGISCHVDSEPIAHDIELEPLDEKGAYASTAVPGGPHSVIVNGKRVASINVEQGQTTCFELADKRLNRVPTILKGGKLPITGTSDSDGRIRFPHLPAGDYLICESKAPASHIADWTEHALTVDGNGLILATDPTPWSCPTIAPRSYLQKRHHDREGGSRRRARDPRRSG